MGARGIYVATTIRATLDEVWTATQEPSQHVRWDVRFSRITPTTSTGEDAARFVYERRTPVHTVRGDGISIGETSRLDGTRTSALRFTTQDRLSPLRDGRGYWRYEPVDDGIRFSTGYDYEAGWGPLDVIVRPLVGWATAWSFDRLRIWLETGVEPERWSIRHAIAFWRTDRPRASRCARIPPHRRRALDDAPATLAALPAPGAHR
ncbi:hypothetical protein QE418_003246 [Microbacterium testaceum]|uniref:SRPBCC family protein n=1 Tax=Microbacterium TaxID=33882 RepID=UPI00278A00B3|nr:MULTISPECIES: SRPBCC family protein [Microbacterium]MDQ1113798.1 hypothetical protein [Microbacterium testaceum]MDR6099097.1 hypothetical protein [Microbacterium sp. SORGH_AS_0454]